MADHTGKQFGNYRLLRLLGQGGFAEVYLGEHVYLKTQAAIKILRLRLAHVELKDFLQEAQTIAHLEHPHIIRVYDFGLEGDIPYFVMHYAPNGSLRQHYPEGTILPFPAMLTHTREIATALQFAHEQGLIHRDIKPENMLLGKRGELLLSDFGVAIVIQHSLQSQRQRVSGTVAYMAPEQLQGKPCTASDQYSLGIIVYEWLCGSRPFQGTLTEIALQHMQRAPRSLYERVPGLDPAINAVVMKALAKDPTQRFPRILDFAIALEQACSQNAELAQNSESAEQTPGTTNVYYNHQAGHTTTPFDPSRQIWHLPYRRNPFFTGRETFLSTLSARLQKAREKGIVQPQAICGLGGMGKTQLAIEYAYRHSGEYQAVLWARADSYETTLAEFTTIARVSGLIERDIPDQNKLIQAVKQWLEEQNDWLLILDNVEDLTMINAFIPSIGKGDLILTTRSQATGTIAQGIELEKMDIDEGALFLLRFSKLLPQDARLDEANDADYIEAKDVARMLDGLPLALEQAGAYIEETGCNLFDYVECYRKQYSTLLELRGSTSQVHPESVATTWLLSFEKLEQFNPIAADLLRACAFLHPDAIPEEIILKGAHELGEQLQKVTTNLYLFHSAIAALRMFSLIRRNTEAKTLTMHRLVQMVLKERMNQETQRLWAERVVRAMNCTFPPGDAVASWPLCQSCLPHVYACVSLIEQWQLSLAEAAQLLDRAGLYLLAQAQYSQAEFLLKKALVIHIQVHGSDHPDVAENLSAQAGIYLQLGKYAQAEPLFVRTLEIRETLQGQHHPDVAVSLNNLALLYKYQGKYAEAVPLFERALAIWEQPQESQGPNPDIARTLNNLALLYQKQGKFQEAEPLYQRALTIWEQIRGPVHPDIAVILNNLAVLYFRLGKYEQAEPLFQRVLEIREQTLGSDHPSVAHSLDYLARLYQKQWKYLEAELLFKQALTIRKHALGPEHPEVAHSLNSLARFYYAQGRYSEADTLFKQALSIREQALGSQHPEVANILKHYAVLLFVTQRKEEAISLIRRAKAIQGAGQKQLQSITVR